MALAEKKCGPCEGGVPKLKKAEIGKLLREIPGWKLKTGKLTRTYVFKNFLSAMELLNRAAQLAEAEGHHPDFRVYSWNKVDFTIFTHAIGGLSENDFILAAKIEALPKKLLV